MARVIKTVTENYTVLDADDGGIIIGNSSSPIAITMPSAIGRTTFSLTVMNANGGTVTVLGQDIAQNEEISIANSNNAWTYALGGGGGGGGTALSELTDVGVTTPSTGQGLVYNGTSSKWENSTLKIARVLTSPVDIYVGSIVDGAGTVSLSGTTVTGVGTSFTNDMVNVEAIIINGLPYRITGYTSATAISVSNDPSDSYSDETYQITQPGASETGENIDNGLISFFYIDNYIYDNYDMANSAGIITIHLAPRVYSDNINSEFRYVNAIITSDSGETALSGYARPVVPSTILKTYGDIQLGVSGIDTGRIYYESNSVAQYATFYDIGLKNYLETTAFTITGAGKSNIIESIVPNNIFDTILYADYGSFVTYGYDGGGGITSDGTTGSNASTYGASSKNGAEIVSCTSSNITGTTANSFTQYGGVVR